MNKRPTSRAKKADIRRQLEAEAGQELDKAARAAMVYGTGILKDGKHLPLKDALRNVSRTATRRLDEAGVPEERQGSARPSRPFAGDWDDWYKD